MRCASVSRRERNASDGPAMTKPPRSGLMLRRAPWEITNTRLRSRPRARGHYRWSVRRMAGAARASARAARASARAAGAARASAAKASASRPERCAVDQTPKRAVDQSHARPLCVSGATAPADNGAYVSPRGAWPCASRLGEKKAATPRRAVQAPRIARRQPARRGAGRCKRPGARGGPAAVVPCSWRLSQPQDWRVTPPSLTDAEILEESASPVG